MSMAAWLMEKMGGENMDEALGALETFLREWSTFYTERLPKLEERLSKIEEAQHDG